MSETNAYLAIKERDEALERIRQLEGELERERIRVNRYKELEGCALDEWRVERDRLEGELAARNEEIRELRQAYEQAKPPAELVEQVQRLEAELATVRKDRELCIERADREAQLACDLRSTQDEIIERCAKVIEEWPAAAERLRTHCGLPDATEIAVSGEDFGELRRELAAARQEIERLTADNRHEEFRHWPSYLRLKEGLRDYGRHEPECECFGDEHNGEPLMHAADCANCDCGLAELLK